ncbi:MAG: hypothetical protein ABI830_02280 [Pseudolabrys sp.]
MLATLLAGLLIAALLLLTGLLIAALLLAALLLATLLLLAGFLVGVLVLAHDALSPNVFGCCDSKRTLETLPPIK